MTAASLVGWSPCRWGVVSVLLIGRPYKLG